jgi:uncharacterized protein YqjF (DUF2071 family)
VIDRISPTHRPLGWPTGYQSWHTILFVHWPVPPEALRPLVPARSTLDLFEGVAYATLVAFAVEEARPVGLPAALGLDFLETNVRTYVHVDGRDPGIYFFSLDAASPLAVLGARLGLGPPYFPARGRLRSDGAKVRYAIRRTCPDRPALAVRYEIGQLMGPAAPGTLEHFLLERYLLHVDRTIGYWVTQVHHRPYPIRRARILDLDDELLGAAGLPPPDHPPLAHFARRVDVDVFPPRRVEPPTDEPRDRPRTRTSG